MGARHSRSVACIEASPRNFELGVSATNKTSTTNKTADLHLLEHGAEYKVLLTSDLPEYRVEARISIDGVQASNTSIFFVWNSLSDLLGFHLANC